MVRLWFRVCVAAAVSVMGPWGCGTQIDASNGWRLTTEVTPSTVNAGETAEVRCVAMHVDGETAALSDATYEVTPESGWTAEGRVITPTAAATYNVRCSAPHRGMADPAGAALEVVPLAPVRVVTTLVENPVTVFHETDVLCPVEDLYGNDTGLTTSVHADPGVQVTGHTVMSEVVGSYEVRCAVDSDPGITVVPATLEVTVGPPDSVVLSVLPDIPVYHLKGKAEFSWVVYDAWGHELSDVPATFTAPEEGILVVDETTHDYRLMVEGHHTFTVQLDPPWDAVSASRTCVVDDSGPTLDILWPARGDQVMGDGEALEVQGQVQDAHGTVAYLQINGEAVAVAADGTFSYTHIPVWGTNLLLCYTEDQYGNLTKLSPSFQYSYEFMGFEETDAQGVKTDDGVILLLGQEFLDDGEHDPTKIDDLATLLEIILSDMDLATVFQGLGVPDFTVPIINFPINLGLIVLEVSGEVSVGVDILPPADIGPTRVTIDTREGGLDIDIEIGDAVIPGVSLTLGIDLTVSASLSWDIFLLGSGAITVGATTDVVTGLDIASLLVQTQTDIHKDAGGPLYVDLVGINVELAGLEIDPFEDLALTFFAEGLPLIGDISFTLNISDLIDLSMLTDPILDPLTTQIVPLLMDLIEPMLETFADDLIVGLLDMLQLETSFELPDLLGSGADPVNLDIYTDLSSVVFDENGGKIGLGLGTYSEKGVEREPLGAIQRAGCLLDLGPDPFEYAWDRPVAGAFKTDAINALLFAVWWSGFLNGPFDASGLVGDVLPIPIDGLNMELEFLLPPLLNDCGTKGVMTVEVSDLRMGMTGELLSLPIEAEMYLDMSLSLFFGATEEGVTVQVGDFGFFDVEVISISEDVLELFDLVDLLENQLRGLLEGFIVGESFGPIALPPISLDGLLPGLPPGVTLQVGNVAIFKQQGYIVGGGELQ